MTPSPSKLLNKNFFLLWQGQFVSQLGNQAYLIAMMFWIKHATESATLMGTLLMASMIPGVVLGPLGGTIADRVSRKKIIVGSDIVAGLTVLVLAFSIWWWPDRVELITILLFIVAVANGVIGSFFRPAISAAIPDLVPTEKVAAANSWNASSVQFSTFMGQGVGGVLFRLLGAPLLFFIDGITFIFSAISESFITIPQKPPDDGEEVVSVARKFVADLKSGFRYVAQIEGVRDLIVIAAVLNFFFTPIMTLFPFYVENTLKATTDWFGYLVAGVGLGGLLGYIAAGSLKVPGRIWGVLISALLLVFCGMFGALAFTTKPLVALGMVLVAGFASGMLNIRIMTVVQLTTPANMRGRVFGLMGTVTGGLSPIAMGLSGVVADLTGQNIPLIYATCAGLTAVMSILLGLSRSFREFVAYEPPPPEAKSAAAQ